MDRGRRPRSIWPLAIALAVSLAALVYGPVLRAQLPDFDGAFAELLDGDLDHAERWARLAVVRDGGLEIARVRGQPEAAVAAASAAVLLGDDPGLQAILTGMSEADLESPFVPGGAPAEVTVEAAWRAGLGVSRLADLWLAHAAENAGRRERARMLYQRSSRSAELAGNALCREVAGRGLARTR